MATISMALPILPGQAARYRSFCKEFSGPRRDDFAASEGRIGITRETWTLQPTPMGDLAIVWAEARDPLAALGAFVASQHQFDTWFMDEVKAWSGVDLREPPEAFPEVLVDWSAQSVGAH